MVQRSVALSLLLVGYFGASALVKPAFQAPDEFAHLTRVLAVPLRPWITRTPQVPVPHRFANPLLDQPLLHEIPFHPGRKFGAAAIDELEALDWGPRDGAVSPRYTNAFNYPGLYYGLLFVLGQGATELLGLGPYDAFYAFRLASAALAAAAWTLLFAALHRLGPWRVPLLAGLALNPMVGMLASSINPDAVFIPLVGLAAALAFDALFLGRGVGRASVALFAALYTKSVAVAVFPVLAALLLGVAALRRRGHTRIAVAWRSAALLLPGVFLPFYLSFYRWRPILMLSEGHSRADYLEELPARLQTLFIGFFGWFGWLDYRAPGFVYALLCLLLLANALVFARRIGGAPERERLLYLVGFAGLFTGVLLAGEWWSLPRSGYVLQGRHLLPVGLGVAALLCHPLRPLRAAFLSVLAALNLWSLPLLVERYYAGRWELLWQALPFGLG
jgi:hypothetical protein